MHNAGLEIIRSIGDRNGTVMFVDDDLMFTTQLFEDMGKIEQGKVGVWPVQVKML
jgi:hypothetical protein